MYSIELKPSARKALNKIADKQRKRLESAIDKLQEDPKPHGSIKLSGNSDLYRIRVGKFRVIYSIENDVLVITIVKVSDRKDAYKKK
ncbi:type II toxin-antitoxin system RelE/ParE family toxin [Lewinella sp. 4G2]|uniref:type II toxin-antitoxin system RelE family toxin n=1 Tax=Lewinella sp. 4G2 TaxID=1803372 RepID=UPI0007B4E18F|nr:type II toxin-antitoxin system RelE/ParE family toxin [Lewinella sp. 4G2]OAV43393.1 hypothetical protein A3850_002270 [Lewinella sp. 4G2]